MPRNSGSERLGHRPRLSLLLLSAAALGSGLLYTAMPFEGPQGVLRLAALLPLQLAAVIWVWPRMR